MNTIKKAICLMILVPASLLFLTTCKEKVLRDCEEQPLVSISIAGSWFCSEKPEILPTEEGNCWVIVGGDTLYAGTFDTKGFFTTGLIPNSRCGLSNVKLEATAHGQTIDTTFSVFCCTDTIALTFEDKNCNVEPIVCDSINKIYTRTIVTSGNCVFQNSNYIDLRDNVIILKSAEKLKLDISSLKNYYKGKIFIKQTIPSALLDYLVLDTQNKLELYFDVNSTVIGQLAPLNITLPAECIDANGQVSNRGSITITVNATICEVACQCPFAATSTDRYYSREKVPVNEQRSSVFAIMPLGGSLGPDCILQIDSITRADGGSPYAAANGESWIIQKPALPVRKVNNESLYINTTFAPKIAGEHTETFVVYTSLYNKNKPTVRIETGTCSYTFLLTGYTCDKVCPQITVLGENVKLFDKNKNTSTPIQFGWTSTFSNSTIIKDSLASRMSINALSKLIIPATSRYSINLPVGDYCSNVNLVISRSKIGNTDDTSFFATTPASVTLGSGLIKGNLDITFTPPFLDDHVCSGHGSTYSCLVTVKAVDGSGTVICQQEIQLDVVVSAIGSRELVILESFSQISAVSSIRSFQIYDIDEYDKNLMNYGQLSSLPSEFVTSTVPYMPREDPRVHFNLFVDVDSPENPAVNIDEKPEIYLVNTTANNFSQITASPVTSFDTYDLFVAAVKDGSLMRSIANDPRFNKALLPMNWSDHRDKTSFGPQQGLPVVAGGVYIVYDANQSPFQFSCSGIRNYLGAALIYVSAVKTGRDNSGGPGANEKGSISFYVEYPAVYTDK